MYLFTWNLDKEAYAAQLAETHLAMRSKTGPWVACLQEIPATSPIAAARRQEQSTLTNQQINVVRYSGNLVPGIALLYHSSLTQIDVEADIDQEYLAALFQLPASKKMLAVVGVHAKSKVDMPDTQDHGGSRALLRHSINSLSWKYDHLVVLGDFNSDIAHHEIISWQCFYALTANQHPSNSADYARRRGLSHAPLYSLYPTNRPLGSYRISRVTGAHAQTIDFIAVDESLHVGSTSTILTNVATKSVWDALLGKSIPSDHLPVEGEVKLT